MHVESSHFQDDELGPSCKPSNIKRLQGVPGAPDIATQHHTETSETYATADIILIIVLIY